MKFIFGLGNPGRKYSKTRHNLGMMTTQRFARERNVKINKHLETCSYGEGDTNDGIIIVFPEVYMNQSGFVIEELRRKVALEHNNLIVIHDDLDIEFSRLKIKSSGSSAGHKGIDSIIDALGTDRFVRIRMGIGRPDSDQDTTDYVLQKFTEMESNKLDGFINEAIEALDVILKYGAEKAMNKFNKKREEVKNGC
jgi:PTH1 family peptidyl-tRNA hydrolase